MKVKFTKNSKEQATDAKPGETVLAVIKRIGINQETFLIKLNGKIAHEQTELKAGDELEFVNVIYGG